MLRRQTGKNLLPGQTYLIFTQLHDYVDIVCILKDTIKTDNAVVAETLMDFNFLQQLHNNNKAC